MKQIIDGKRYDTATAEEIAHHWNGHPTSDFKTCTETLYRTKKGAFFLHGEGGPMSIYSKSVSGGYTYGEKIVPMTDDDVVEWLERCGLTDELEELFPDRVEDA